MNLFYNIFSFIFGGIFYYLFLFRKRLIWQQKHIDHLQKIILEYDHLPCKIEDFRCPMIVFAKNKKQEYDPLTNRMQDYSPLPEPKVKSMEAVKKLIEHYGKVWTLPKTATKEELDKLMADVSTEGKKLAEEAFEYDNKTSK